MAFNVTDNAFRAHSRFARFTSLTQAGVDINKLEVNDPNIDKMIREYREKIIKIMSPAFKVPMVVRAESGQYINIDEALDGVAECYRRTARTKRAPLRIGLNVSRDHYSENMVALRGAAVLALIELCKSRGQNVYVEVVYGNGITTPRSIWGHVRIELQHPTIDLMKRLACSNKTIWEVGLKAVEPLCGHWQGFYRMKELLNAGLPKEYDFFLDRINTMHFDLEYGKIMKQLTEMKLMG